MKGLDYSWGRPNPAAIKADGFDFVMRYVPYPGHGGKGATKAEIAALRAAGLAVGLVFESTAERHLDGKTAGVADAMACQAAITALGFPEHLPIYFGVDFDAQGSDFAAIRQYQAGAAAILGADRVGVYGSASVIDFCRENGAAKWFWQTYAWSGGRVTSGVHLYQYSNGERVDNQDVDFNSALQPEQGLWTVEDEMTTDDLKIMFDQWAIPLKEQIRQLQTQVWRNGKARSNERDADGNPINGYILEGGPGSDTLTMEDIAEEHKRNKEAQTIGFKDHTHDGGKTGGVSK